MKHTPRDIIEKILILLCILGFSILFISNACAQNCSLSMTVSHTAVEQLSISDIDFDHFQSNNLFFAINITNTQSISLNAILYISIDIQLVDNAFAFDNPIIKYQSREFEVRRGGRSITNLDLGRNASDVKTEDFKFEENAKSKLQDVILATGKLPAGIYTFHFELIDNSCGKVATSDNIVIDLRNPSRVELRSPRDGEVTNDFPLFEFYQESDRAVLTVAEKNPDQSREDAIQRKPPMLEIELMGQNAVPYSGGRPLEPGKSYAWQIVSKIRSAGGADINVSSPIWLFTVSSSPQASNEDGLLNQLEEMLSNRYPGIFKQIHDKGFKFVGSYILNESTLTRSELLNLLNRLRESSDNIDLSFE